MKTVSSKFIHLIYGNQQLLVDEAIKKLTEVVLEERAREWCFERYDFRDLLNENGESGKTKFDDFMLSCETPSMFSDRKLFRFDHAELLKQSAKKDSQSLPALFYQAISGFLDSPPRQCWFLFTSQAMREQQFSRPFFRRIREKGTVQKFVAYEDHSPWRWVQNRGREKGMTLSAEDAQTLVALVGTELYDLEQELDKLKLGIGGEGGFSEDTLRKFVRGHKHFSVFRMTDSLAHKQLKSALEILDQQLLESPREHVRIFAMIVLQFRRMLSIHYFLQQNITEASLPGKIGLPPFLAKQALQQSRNFKSAELERIMIELARLDLEVKFHGKLAGHIMTDLFQRICAGGFR